MKLYHFLLSLLLSYVSFSQKKNEFLPINQMTTSEKDMYVILQKSVNQLQGCNNTKLFPYYKKYETDKYFIFSSLIYDTPDYTNWEKKAFSSTFKVELQFSKIKKHEDLVGTGSGNTANEKGSKKEKEEYHLIIDHNKKTLLYLKKETPFFENLTYDVKFYKTPIQENHINTYIYKNLSEKETISYIDDSIAIIKRNFKYGIINNRNEIILPFKYDFIGKYKYGILVKENDLNYFVNNKGEKISPNYDEIQINFSGDFSTIPDCFKVKIGNKYTLTNNTFKQLLPLIYDSITIFSYKNKPNYLLLKKEGKQIIFDIDQWKETNIIYDTIEALDHENYIVTESQKVGMINTMGKIVLPIEYDKINFLDFDTNSSMYLTIAKKNKVALYNMNKFVTGFNYDIISKFSNVFKVKIDNKYGLISRNGTILIPAINDSIEVNKNLRKIEVRKNSTIDYYDISVLDKT